MAGNKLEVGIGADISDFSKKIKEVEYDLKELSKLKVERLKVGLDTTEINAQIKDVKNTLRDLKTTTKDTGAALTSTGTSMTNFGKQTANGGSALTAFSRIAQDAPYGIIGIGNNITNTAEQFGYLVKQTGSAGGAFKALASSLTGVGGVLLAVSLVTTAFTVMSQQGLSIGDVFDKLTGKGDSLASAMKRVQDEAFNDKGVQEAVTNVNKLTTEVELAKQGFLNKNKVVEHYNETMGKTTGIVKTLDEVEQELVKNGDAYVKMTLYKAAANLALEDAAKAQLEAEKSRVKKLSEFTSAFLDADLSQTRSKEQYEKKQQNLANQAKLRQEEEVKINETAANKSLAIAKKFQTDAAKISKDFKFNFFGDTKQAKQKEVFNTPQVSGVQSNLISAPLFDLNSVAVFNGQVDEFGNKVKTLPGTITTAMSFVSGSIVQPISDELMRVTELMMQFNESANALIQDSIASTFGNLGSVIGEALATGGNVLSAIGQSLLQSLGNFLSEMGGLLIKYGTLAVLKGNLDLAILTGGPVSIGAGIAAIAVGVALKAAGGAIGAFSSSGGSRKAQTSGGSNSNFSSTTGGFSSTSSGSGTVVFEIAGQKLIGVLSNTLNANRRLGGQIGL